MSFNPLSLQSICPDSISYENIVYLFSLQISVPLKIKYGLLMKTVALLLVPVYTFYDVGEGKMCLELSKDKILKLKSVLKPADYSLILHKIYKDSTEEIGLNIGQDNKFFNFIAEQIIVSPRICPPARAYYFTWENFPDAEWHLNIYESSADYQHFERVIRNLKCVLPSESFREPKRLLDS